MPLGLRQVFQTPRDTPRGLVMRFDFSDRSFTDNSGFNNFISGGVPNLPTPAPGYVPRVGRRGNAMLFNGTNQAFRLASSTLVNSLSGGLSLSVWVNPPTLAGGGNYAIMNTGFQGSGANNIFWDFRLAGANVHWTTLTSGVTYGVLFTPSVPVNAWTHIGATFDGTTWRVYLNGTLAAAVTGNAPSTGLGQPTQVGAINDSGLGSSNNYFGGLMADLRVYNRPLSAGEMSTIFHSRFLPWMETEFMALFPAPRRKIRAVFTSGKIRGT